MCFGHTSALDGSGSDKSATTGTVDAAGGGGNVAAEIVPAPTTPKAAAIGVAAAGGEPSDIHEGESAPGEGLLPLLLLGVAPAME